MTELRGAVAVVTGAASGLGFGLSACLVAAGARVAMIDVEADALVTAVASIDAPDATLPIVADVAVART